MTSGLTAKQQFWSNHLQNAEQSNGSIADYARQNNLVPQRLYQWRNALRKQTRTSISTETMFTQAIVFPEREQPQLTMSVGPAQLSFNKLPDPDWLAALLTMRSHP